MAQAINTAGRLQDQGDVNVTPAVGVDGYAFTYDHDTGKFILAAAGGAKVGGTGEANGLVIGAGQTRPVVLLQEDLGYGGSYGVFKPLAVSLNFTYATYVSFKNGVYFSGAVIFSSDASYDANKRINLLAGNSATGAYIVNPHATLARLALAAGNAVRMTIDEAGLVGVGTETPAALLHADQASTTGAVPVLTVDQADVSEEFIRFIGTSAADASQTLIDAADMTTPGALKGWLKIYVQDDAASGAITDGAYYVPFYAAPTA